MGQQHRKADEPTTEDKSGVRRARVSFHDGGTDTLVEPWRVRQFLCGMEGIQVLLVDTDADDAELLRIAFDAAGAMVRTSTSTVDALASLEKDAAQVIIVGLGPDSPHDLCREVRARALSDSPVIVAVGAQTSAEARMNAQVVGYDLYLVKPTAPHRVVAAVRDLLDN